ncbi:MAG: hypothetical protein IPK02_00650 [Candidatus Accumulibacter sp.]|jgi:hypothetical protein|uniref:Uncharacterized protein n=1 Tax=Candidatus Accumulibacter affinis TaxID=2954384 RepID=A0A935W1T5_9PROT|nr:hypothetical protein [Candidatus Accumulibacter affinis]
MAKNLLRVDDGPGEDTRRMVREVLAFMVDSLYDMENRSVHSTGSSLGAGHILFMCADALREADDGGGEQ